MEEDRRVVVTGMGVIHALGSDAEDLWDAVAAGKSGIGAIRDDRFSRFPTRIAACVSDFPEDRYLDGKESKNWDRFARFAVWSAAQAWDKAGAASAGVPSERVGVWMGTGIGGAETLLRAQDSLGREGSWRTSPYTIPMMIGNMGAGLISMKLGTRGPCLTPMSACATGNNAIGEAFLAIREGRVDMAIAGGAEAPILPVAFSGFNSMRAMSTRNENPQTACAPFALGRDGFVMGEGAASLILGSRANALRRGASIFAEIVGYGATSDAYHLTSPDPEGRGAASAMREAARMAGWAPSDVEYINAHGTGTVVGDIAETKAIKSFCGGIRAPLVSSTKAATGHLFGAAGGIEAILCIQAIRHGALPPTLNLREPDPDCDLDCIPIRARAVKVSRVLSNGFGFGGHNAVLAIARG